MSTERMDSRRPEATDRPTDRAGLVGALVLGAAGAYVFASSFSISPMAAMFPRTIGAVMVALCALQIAASLTGRSRRGVEAGASVADQAEGLGRRLTLIAVMLGWAILFPILGMFVTSIAASLLLMTAGQFGRLTRLRLAVYVAAVVVMVSSFYLLMTEILNIPMPRGLFY